MKGILDKEKVLDMREQYFRFMTENGDTGILAKNIHLRYGKDWRNFLLPGARSVFNDQLDEGVFVDKVLKAHISELY